MKINVSIEKNLRSGRIINEYAPLKNIYILNPDKEQSSLFDFDVSTMKLDLSYPVDIICQNSYDNSVNLILNDGVNEPRLVNSSFTVKPKRTFERVERNQKNKTNIYNYDYLKESIKLFKTVNTFPKIKLYNISEQGKLKGGNYTLYIKLSDEDDNITPVVCESGVIQIYKGSLSSIPSIQGTLMHEITNKCMNINISDLDTTFSEFYIYMHRYYSDMNGVVLSEYLKITKPYAITSDNLDITITGLEETESVSVNELTETYNTYNSVGSQTEVQKMLFFGNTEESITHNPELQQLSYYIKVKPYYSDDSKYIGYVTHDYDIQQNRSIFNSEYYNSNNVYNYLGYWPGEYYRFGVVYIYDNDTLSPVYNLRGYLFNDLVNDNQIINNYDGSEYDDVNVNEIFINGDYNYNSKGVFKMPDLQLQFKTDGDYNTRPLGIQFSLDEKLKEDIIKASVNNGSTSKIKGLFFVRQKRIPIVIAQAYSICVDDKSHLPMLYDQDNGAFTESFISQDATKLISNKVYGDSEDINVRYSTSKYVNEDNYSCLQLNSYPNNISSNEAYTLNLTTLDYVFNNDESNDDTDNEGDSNLEEWEISHDITTNTMKWRWIDSGKKHISIESKLQNGIVGDVTINMPSRILSMELKSHYTTSYKCNINIRFNDYTTYKDINNECELLFTKKQYKIVYVDDNGDNYKESDEYYEYEIKLNILNNSQSSTKGLICADADLNPQIQSLFDGSEFVMYPVGVCNLHKSELGNNYIAKLDSVTTGESNKYKLVYIPTDNSYRIINNNIFSTRAGNPEDTDLKSLIWNEESDADERLITNGKLIRGVFTSFIGILDSNVIPGCIYNICSNETDVENIITVRAQNHDMFYAVSNRFNINDFNTEIIYRGDCFCSTVSKRMMCNFINNETPTNDLIVDYDPWHGGIVDGDKIPKTFDQISKCEDIQLGDWNAVQLGHFITYKCLSNYNLGMRCEDVQYTDERALLGNARSYYPATSKSKISKVPESTILNLGYSSTLPIIPYFEYRDVPYIINNFSNRIAFSRPQTQGAFRNDYRIFQDLSYKDIDNKYGGITKIIGIANNIFCVFDNGCGIVPVNEKALISTQTGSPIGMYGYNVLTDRIQVVSEDYGSIWKDSIIKTPNGIYGVDTFAKKIWCYNAKGFQIISDMLVQRFLNDNINLSEIDKNPTIGLTNVKTHYNNFKGDVMFTFYHDNKTWNLCYNERLDKWITRYSWIPLSSSNIQNQFVSIDMERSRPYAIIQRNQTTNNGLFLLNSAGDRRINVVDFLSDDNINLLLSIQYDKYNVVGYIINKVEFAYVQNDEYKIDVILNNENFDKSDFNEEFVISNNLFVDKYPLYLIIDITAKIKHDIHLDDDDPEFIYDFNDKVALIADYNNIDYKDIYEKYMRSNIYIHGKAGVSDEILNGTKEIKPTLWYDKQESFEFEFSVNQPSGLHKIFNNLCIISNNVEPNELEFSLIGDVYNFKDDIIKNSDNTETKVEYDHVLNQYILKSPQKVKNIKNKKYGRLRGNIEYKEDRWNYTIQPIKYNSKNSRIRDKWVKIRIKYKGDSLVVINAIQTLETLSFA